jgi:hypothetical protein
MFASARTHVASYIGRLPRLDIFRVNQYLFHVFHVIASHSKDALPATRSSVIGKRSTVSSGHRRRAVFCLPAIWTTLSYLNSQAMGLSVVG